MGLGRFLGPRENRELTYTSLWLSDQLGPSSSLAGVTVSQRTAMALSAVYASVRIIADPISTFPVGTFIRVNGERRPFFPRPLWVDQPDPDPSVHRSDHYQALLVSLLLSGNGYVRIFRDDRGNVMSLRVLDPTRVEPRLNGAGLVEFVVTPAEGGTVVLPARDVLHLTDLRKPGAIKGSSRIDDLKETFGIGRALDDYVASYFGQGTVGGRVVIEMAGDVNPEQAEQIKDAYESKTKGRRNWHRPNVVGGGGKIHRLSDNAEQAQLTAAREFFILETARAFRIPPSRLAVNTPGTRAYASVEQDAIDFVGVTLKFYVDKIEEAYSRLLSPTQAFLRLNMDSLLRGDIGSRFTAYGQGIAGGFLTVADIRRLEDLSPIPGAEVLRVPLENIDVSAAGLVAQQRQVEMYQRLIQSGVEPDAAAAAVGLPPMRHSGLPSVQVQAPHDPSGDSPDDSNDPSDSSPQE